MSDSWEDRSLFEMANSKLDDRHYSEPQFGTPLTDNMPRQAQPASSEMRQTGQSGDMPVGPDGKVHGRATYAPSGIIPDGNGGGVLYNPPRAPSPGQGVYGDRTGGPQMPPGLFPDQNWSPTNVDSPRTPGTTSRTAAGRTGEIDERTAQIIANSLNGQFNPVPYFAEAAAGGLMGSALIPYLMDRRYGGSGNWWDKNFSPMGMEIGIREQKRSVDETAAGEARDKWKTYFLEQRQAKRDIATSTSGLETYTRDQTAVLEEMRANGAPDTRILAQSKKVDVFTAATEAARNIDKNALSGSVWSKEDEIGPTKYLTEAEKKMLEQHRDLYDRERIANAGRLAERSNFKGAMIRVDGINAEINELKTNPKAVQFDIFNGYRDAKGNVMGASAMEAASRNAGSLERPWKEWGGRNPYRAAGEGMAAATVGLVAGYIGDKIFFGKDNYPSGSGTVWQSAVGPAAAFSLIKFDNPMLKIGGTVAAVLGAQAMDSFVGTSRDATYSEYLKPNVYGAVGMGAGWMLPFRNPNARLAAVVGGWGLGVAANALNELGVPVPGVQSADAGRRLWDNVSSDAANNTSGPSLSNFNSLIESSTKLAMENERAMGARITQYAKDHQAENKPSKWETLAAMDIGLGNMWLARGPRMNESSIQKQDDEGRIMAGMNYDLGGRAAQFFHAARGLAQQSETFSTRNGSLDDARRAQEERKIAEEKLGSLYGSHDMEQVFRAVKEKAVKVEDMVRLEMSLTQRVAKLDVNDSQFRAKLYRDLAVVDLAIASFKGTRANGDDGRVYFQKAVQALRNAGGLDRDSSDLKQLQDIANRVQGEVNQGTQDQYNSTIKNPFGIQTPRY